MSGYIGYRKVPTTLDGGGTWRLGEQAKFLKDGIWPTLDPYWSNVVLRMPMDAGFTDFSSSQKTINTFGNLSISTSVKKFGSGSGYFDGTGDYLTTTTSPSSFSFVDVNGFSVECWVYASSWESWSGVSPRLLGKMESASGNNDWSFGPTASGILQFYYWNGAQQFISTVETLSTSQWVHIAFKYYNGQVMLYLNGTLVKTGSISGTPSTALNVFCIGQHNNGAINGYVDDVRITKGANRSIILPTEAYPIL